MRGRLRKIIEGSLIGVTVSVFALLLPGGCSSPARVFTIGISAHPQRDAGMLNGFKEGMASLGYIEGKTIKYIHEYMVTENVDVIKPAIQKLLAQDLDLIIVSGKSGIIVRDLTKGTGPPVLFYGSSIPVEDGLVESLKHPGGNITGIRAMDSISKTLEWLAKLAPGTKKIWLPYDPDDKFSIIDVSRVEKAARQLKVDLVLQQVHSVEETIAAIQLLPEDVGAVFFIPSERLFPGSSEISQAAMNRGLLTGSPNSADDSLLIFVATDPFSDGKKMARLANQILQGVSPSDIPVEVPDPLLTINLKTAEKIGLDIPDDVLLQAQKIIR